jgi:hypothetical protein
MEPWTKHVNGALALLDYRGAEQLTNENGLQLIRSLRISVVSYEQHFKWRQSS